MHSRAVGISCNIFYISTEGTRFSKGLPQSVTSVAVVSLILVLLVLRFLLTNNKRE